MRLGFHLENQCPVPPRGQNKAVIPLYLLRDFGHLSNKTPRSPASLCGNRPILPNANPSRQFWPAAGKPDPDSCPPSLVGDGRVADRDTKSGKSLTGHPLSFFRAFLIPST